MLPACMHAMLYLHGCMGAWGACRVSQGVVTLSLHEMAAGDTALRLPDGGQNHGTSVVVAVRALRVAPIMA